MVIAGIVAGGVGSRMGNTGMPKQFLEVGGRPIIIHTIERFAKSPDIDGIVVGVHPDWQDYLSDLLVRHIKNSENIEITAGGSDRNQTIQHIIDRAAECWDIDDDAIFVTHDAVRPFVSSDIIEENVRLARENGVCGTVIHATDTMACSDDGRYITDMPVRDRMYQVQTPQSFTYRLFKEVFGGVSAGELAAATDVCGLFCGRGYRVAMVEGSAENFKITRPVDLRIAEGILVTFQAEAG